jgi:hypothetical protein
MVSFHNQRDEITFAVSDAKPIHTWTQGAKFKPMVKFSAKLNGTLELRLEYSTESFTERDMKGFFRAPLTLH